MRTFKIKHHFLYSFTLNPEISILTNLCNKFRLKSKKRTLQHSTQRFQFRSIDRINKFGMRRAAINHRCGTVVAVQCLLTCMRAYFS